MGLICFRNCGTEIMFDEAKVSKKSGKKIPLELDGTPHRCPNSTYKRKESNTGFLELTERTGFKQYGNFIVRASEYDEFVKEQTLLSKKKKDVWFANPNST